MFRPLPVRCYFADKLGTFLSRSGAVKLEFWRTIRTIPARPSNFPFSFEHRFAAHLVFAWITLTAKLLEPTQTRRLKSVLDTLRQDRFPFRSLLKRSLTTSSCSPSNLYTQLKKFTHYYQSFVARRSRQLFDGLAEDCLAKQESQFYVHGHSQSERLKFCILILPLWLFKAVRK